MKFYENIENERERIQNCIRRFGWTSDHNLDWFIDCIVSKDGRPVFVEFSDGTGLLAHRYKDKWRIWSDPLCEKQSATDKIFKFADRVLNNEIRKVWCDDVSDTIYSELKKSSSLLIDDIYYSLQWPVLDMDKYDLTLPGGHFKDIRNAKNKFYREHNVQVVSSSEIKKEDLYNIFANWKNVISQKQDEKDISDLKYHNAIENNFRAFLTARVFVVDGQPVGLNAGYEVPNVTNRFAGIIGIHDYSTREAGLMLWLEDLDWIKNTGYKELDMQGDEGGGGLEFKMQFGPIIERKTDTFSKQRK